MVNKINEDPKYQSELRFDFTKLLKAIVGIKYNQQMQFIHFGHWWKRWDVFEISGRPKESRCMIIRTE